MKHIVLIVTALIIVPFMGSSQTVDQLNKPIISGLDEVTSFNEGLAAVRKGDQWGFIDTEGKLVIGFRKDLVANKDADISKYGVEGIRHPQFKEGLCIIEALTEEGIPHYGFIDKTGKQVIEPEFLNVAQFDNGFSIGIYERKDFRGKNEFQFNIYEYAFTEVIVNKTGEMVWPISERQNIVMSKKLYKIPQLHAKMLTQDLLANKTKDGHWKVVKVNLK